MSKKPVFHFNHIEKSSQRCGRHTQSVQRLLVQEALWVQQTLQPATPQKSRLQRHRRKWGHRGRNRRRRLFEPRRAWRSDRLRYRRQSCGKHTKIVEEGFF